MLIDNVVNTVKHGHFYFTMNFVTFEDIFNVVSSTISDMIASGGVKNVKMAFSNV